MQWIQRGLKAIPNDPELTADRAAVLLAVGQPQEAVQALAGVRSTARIEYYRGLAYRALRDDRAAQQAFSRAFEMGYPDPYVLYALIEEDHALRDEQAGLKHFTVFSRRFPNSPWLNVLLGNAYVSRHDLTNAEVEYKLAVQRNPDLPTVHYALGRLAFDRGDYLTAAEDFRKEIELDPSFGKAYLYLGVTLRRQGKNGEALPFLEKAVQRDPNFALAYTELATAQIELRKLQDALHTLQTAKERFPKEAAFPAQLSHLLERLGRQAEAKKESALAENLSRKGNPRLHNASDSSRSQPARGAGAAVPTKETARPSLAPASAHKGVPQAASSNAGGAKGYTAEGHLDPALGSLSKCLERNGTKCPLAASMNLAR